MSSWRDIAMPDTVASRPTSPGGLPVPYVAQWSSERTLKSARDPLLTRLGVTAPAAYSTGELGQGQPDFGVMEPSRQREVALLVRCQVCRAQLLPGRRYEPAENHPVWLADLRSPSAAGDVAFGGSAIRIGRRLRPLIFEPWICELCLAYALQVCPGMLSRSYEPTSDPKRDLRLLRVRKAHPVATYANGDLVGTVVSYVKLAAIRYDVVTPTEFLGSARTEAA